MDTIWLTLLNIISSDSPVGVGGNDSKYPAVVSIASSFALAFALETYPLLNSGELVTSAFKASLIFASLFFTLASVSDLNASAKVLSCSSRGNYAARIYNGIDD